MIKSSNKVTLTVSEPNLIPLLDFMLVLVVMFVLLVGPIQQAIKLPVPEIKSGVATAVEKDVLLISLAAKNDIYVAGKHFDDISKVEKHLKEQAAKISEITIAVDKSLEIDTLMKLFATTKALGIKTANIQVENQPS